MYRLSVALIIGLSVWSVGQASDGDVDPLTEATLRQAHAGTDGPALLALFRRYTLTPGDRQQIKALIHQLNDDSFDIREKASERLLEFGPRAAPLLRQAIHGPALEVSRRARKCLARMPAPPTEALAAAARLLVVHHPPGTVATLLAYLADGGDEQIAGDVQAALTAFAFAKGRPNPRLCQALGAPEVGRRLAAAEALAQQGGRRAIELVRPLLRDPAPEVRARVAQHLADLREADAISVLISLTASPTETATQADASLRELAGSAAPAPLVATAANRETLRKNWQHWWQTVRAADLVDRVRRCTPNESVRLRAATLIEQLGDDNFTVRQRASEALATMGPIAVPLLKTASKNADFEIAHRARVCLTQLEADAAHLVSASTLREIALCKPAGAADALLAYLPYAAEGPGLDEVQDALVALAYPNHQPAPALLRALSDTLPLRRQVAGIGLAHGGHGMPPSLAVLLHDPVLDVRLEVALALAEQKEPASVPTLIALLRELPTTRAAQAEDLLRRLAGSEAPAQPSTESEAERKRYAVAWLAWWNRRHAQVDMDRLDMPTMESGRLVAVCYDGYEGCGRVWEMGLDHKARWEITKGLRGPIDAVMLGGDRVLIAEYNGFITERDTRGKVLLERRIVGNPIACQRLPDGHLFVATLSSLMELTAQGKEIYNRPVQHGSCTGARVLRDGHVVYVNMTGTVTELDRQGKEVRSFETVDGANAEWRTLTVLRNGHYLIPRMSTRKVSEYTRTGKLISQVAAPMPYAAVRLANGRLMTASMTTNVLAEVDRKGEAVWQERLKGRPFMIRWR